MKLCIITQEDAREPQTWSRTPLSVIECMEKEGCSEKNLHLKSADEIYRYMMRGYLNPTSAFPSIVEQTINKSYQEGHKRANTTYRRIAKIGTLSDFKKNDNYWVAGTAGEKTNPSAQNFWPSVHYDKTSVY